MRHLRHCTLRWTRPDNSARYHNPNTDKYISRLIYASIDICYRCFSSFDGMVELIFVFLFSSFYSVLAGFDSEIPNVQIQICQCCNIIVCTGNIMMHKLPMLHAIDPSFVIFYLEYRSLLLNHSQVSFLLSDFNSDKTLKENRRFTIKLMSHDSC